MYANEFEKTNDLHINASLNNLLIDHSNKINVMCLSVVDAILKHFLNL